MSENKNKAEGAVASKQSSNEIQNKRNKTSQAFVPPLSIYGKVNTILTNDPEGYQNKESDEVYELLSSSLEIYLRDIVKKMSENRQQRLNRITKVVNGKPVKLSNINKVIEKINKEEKKLELQRKRSRKENGIEPDEEGADGTEEGKNGDSTQAAEKPQPKMTAKAAANSQSLEAQMNDNNSTANLFTGGMNKKYSWLSGGASSSKINKAAAAKPSSGSLSGNPFASSESSYVQSDIRNHIIKEEKNLVMRDLIKVLESELNNDSKKISTKDVQEILAKGYARLRD